MSDTIRETASNGPGLTPPQALDAERSILAAMMLDASAIGRAVEMIDGRVFYRSAHSKIYEALVSLFNRNEPADLITVTEELKRRGDYEAVGGAAGLAQILDHATTSANLEHHARIVHSKSVLRELIKASSEIQQQCYGGHEETAILLDQAEARIFGITDQRIRQGFTSIRDLLKPAFDNIQKLFERKVQVTGVPTGWDDLDKLTSGWQPGDLVILAGRPAMGKCVSWRTLVVDPTTGERLTAEECVLRRMPQVLGIDDVGAVRNTAVGAWIDSGIKPCFRVTTKLGRSIEVTGHHPFLTTDGWTPLHDLKVGDAIGVPSIMPVAGTDTSWPLTRVRLLAYLIAEGGLSRDTPQFTTADPDHLADFMACMVAMEPAGAGTSTQRLPGIVWHWDRERLGEFLRVLLSFEAEEPGNARFETDSARLATDVQHALLRLGALAEVAEESARWIVAARGEWRLESVHTASRSPMSTRSRDAAQAQAAAVALAEAELQLIASEDLYWDPITEITPVGEMQVYDLTVPDGSNFIANDICVHNTACVMNMAENAAIRYSIPVAVFSLEMSKEQLALRLLCSQSEVPLHKVRTGYLGNEDWPRLTTGAGLLTQAPIYIDDSPAQSVLEIRAKCRRLKADGKLGLIVIDYLQLMRASTHAENRVQEISQISRGLKALAKELSVPIIALSQLSRAVEQRGGSGRPQLSDLRESGCLTADARVLRADTGAEVTLGELLASGEKDIPVWSVDESFRLVQSTMTHAFPSGVKPVFEMRLTSGRTIKASANHKFLTFDGWRRLDELAVGMRLATPRRVAVPSKPTAWPEAELVMLAHLVGDGCVAPRQPIHYTSSDEACIEAVEQAALHFGITPRRVRQENWWHVYLPSPHHLTHGKRNPISAWLDRFGLYGKRSYEKFIPSEIFGLSDDQIALFLRHLWSTDGCIHPDPKQVRAYYGTTSARLANDVQQLLLRFGIRGRIKSTQKRGYRPSHNVHIYGRDQLSDLLELVGCHGHRGGKAEEALALLQHTTGGTNLDTVPVQVWASVRAKSKAGGVSSRSLQQAIGTHYCGSTLYRSAPGRDRLMRVATALDDYELHSLAESDLFWDEIRSIEPLGEQPVFDATVLDTHNFIANGVVVHNSIEQDADVVMFVYREVMYKPDTQEPGKAQIIIAKQRNGPTDDVDMTFIRECTKFVPYSPMTAADTETSY